MTNIQTPVTVPKHSMAVNDADGAIVACAVTVQYANQITDALNRTADLEAKLATAMEAFAEVDEWIRWTIPADEGKWTSNQDRRRIDEHKQLKEIVDKALATISGDAKGDDDGK